MKIVEHDNFHWKPCGLLMRTCFTILCLPAMAMGQHGSTHEYQPKELQQHFLNAAEQHVISIEGRKLELTKQPLMHWSNPVRKQEQGSLFVWSDAGQPEVLASIFTYGNDEGTLCRHEMISIADKPLVCQLDNETVWSPTEAGTEWKAFADAAAPADSKSRRLLQMRTLARSFSGLLYNPGQSATQLTLLPQPLHRWESKEHDILDGALFSLAVATDPEMFLLIETKAAEPGWRYSVVRSHFFGLELQRNGQTVKSFDGLEELLMTQPGQAPWASKPYFIFFESEPLPHPETLR